MLRFENSTELRTALGEWNARYFPPRGASETTDAFVRCSQCPSATYWNASCSGTVTEADQGSQGLADCQSYCSSDSSCDLWLIAGNSVYQRFDTLKTHADAKADCESRGMRLATVRSAADNARLVTVAFGDGNTLRPYFGANDIAVEGEWREGSDSSSPLISYTNWNDVSHGGSEPNDSGGNEDCVKVQTDGLWNDVPCTYTSPYVCEAPPGCKTYACDGFRNYTASCSSAAGHASYGAVKSTVSTSYRTTMAIFSDEGACDLLPTTDVDLNEWDVSRITDMSSLFAYMHEFDADVNGWDTSSVTTMGSIFKNAYSFNHPLNSWDVSVVTDMSRAFEDATRFNQPLSHWKPRSDANMTDMFLVQHADGERMSPCNKRRTHLAFTVSSAWSQSQEGNSLAAVTSPPYGVGWSGFLCKAGFDYNPGGSSLGQSPISNVPTVLRCQHRCEATPGCVAIVYTDLGQCSLKASYGEFTNSVGPPTQTSCVRQDFTCLENTLDASPCLGLSAHVNAGLSASQCPVTGVSSIEACQQHCRNVTGCEAITYSDAQECWLKPFWGGGAGAATTGVTPPAATTTSVQSGSHSCRRHQALDPHSCVSTHSFCCTSGTCVAGVCVGPPTETQWQRKPNPDDVDHLWDFEQGLGGFVQLPSPGQAGDSGSCGIQPVSYMHARIFKGPRGILPRGRFVSTYAPGGWQAPSDVYQCTFEDRSHAFTLTPRTMVGLMVSLSKNRYVGLYRCSNDSEALVTATWPGENNQMVHRTLLNVPFSLDKYALFMGERVFVRFADLSSESWSHIQIDDIEVKGAGDVGPCEPAPPSCWFSGPTVFRISKPAEPSVNGGRVYLSVGANPPSPYLQTYVAGVDESQKWTITSLGGGLMQITPNGSTTNSTHLSIDPTTSAVGLTEGTGNNRTWAIAYAGEDDIDGETLWTVKSQSMTAANGRVWLSTSADGSDVGVSSVVIANSRWRIGCLPSTSNACSTYEAEDAKRLGPTQREEYGGSTGFNFTVVEFQSPGDYLEWSVSMPSAGSVAVRWRYALAFGSKPLNLSINGAVDQTIAFPNTGSGGTFAHTTAVTLVLPSGSNALRLTDPSEAPASILDFMEVCDLMYA